jgi:hypothetical protein
MAGAILVALVLMCVSLILIGALLQKPHGFIIVALAVIALLLIAIKGFPSL